MPEIKDGLAAAEFMHDIKNSVQAQTKGLMMLSKGVLGELNSEQKEIIDLLLKSSETLQENLFYGITACKYENGLIVLNKSEFDAVEFVLECINKVKVFAAEKNVGILFNSNIKDGKTCVYADKIRLGNAFGNIFNNIIKYAFEGSFINITLSVNNSYMIFEFENSSPEIPDTIRGDILNGKVLVSENYKTFGTGLGLYLVRKIAEAHNGRMFLSSEGIKNKFTVELPCNCIQTLHKP